MKTDKELLELAAKALNCKIRWRDMKGGYERTLETPKLDGKWWNPLTDDGDALRLAVKFRLDMIDCKTYISVWGKGIEDCDEYYGNDSYAATRRAIVRAAAAIGEKL